MDFFSCKAAVSSTYEKPKVLELLQSFCVTATALSHQ